MVSRRLGLRVAAVGTAVFAGLTGCTGSSTPEPSPPQRTSISPSASAATSPADQLQQLAATGASASYHAFYGADQKRPSSKAKWTVWRTEHSLRVDVITSKSTATLIQTRRATYSCSRAHGRKACFRVAKAGKPVPRVFQLLAERLFSTVLVQFAQHASRYAITPATGGAAVGAGSCFVVKVPAGQPASVEPATYCFNDNGVLTAVRYRNGNAVQLLKVVMRTPDPATFRPYSSPTPLPS